MSDFDLGNFLINGDEDNKLHEYQTKVIEGLLANPPDQNDITIVEYVFPISKSLCGKYRGNSIFLLDDSNNAKSILENDNWRNFFIKVLFIFYIKKIDYAIFGNEEWIVRTCLHYFSTITTYPLIQYLIKCIYLTNNFYIDNNKIGYENTIEIKTIIFNHISLSYMDYSKNKDIIESWRQLLEKSGKASSWVCLDVCVTFFRSILLLPENKLESSQCLTVARPNWVSWVLLTYQPDILCAACNTGKRP